MLDLDSVRPNFPALQTPWVLMDNAGGSVPCRQVIDRVRGHLERLPVQLGASYELSVQAGEAISAGRRAAALLFGADPDEMVFGASSTVLVQQLARSLRPLWQSGDEVVVTNLDHEANIGPWRALEATGIVPREWRFRPDTASLELEDLEALLNPRTRLVAFTHCSNVVGNVHDVKTIAARIRSMGALTCVDGVAYAPHRRVDVRALGVDFYFASLYKVFGPHLALLFGRRELLVKGHSPNHFFVAPDAVPVKHEPGNVNYELAASVPGILEYLQSIAGSPAVRSDSTGTSSSDFDPSEAFCRIADHEGELARPLLRFLDEHPRVRLLGKVESDPTERVPTVAFTVQDRKSSEIPSHLDCKRIATRFGHFYAYRAIRDLGLLERDGVVRISLVHYNTAQEVERLLEELEAVL